MVYEVHSNDMQQALAAPAALVDFNATWCNPCRMLAPVLQQLSDEMDGKLLFYSVDVDENPALAAQYGIQSIPALLLLKNGQPVAQQVGFVPKPHLQSWIESSL